MVPENLGGWSSFCKTQFANEFGIPNSRRDHMAVCAILDKAQDLGGQYRLRLRYEQPLVAQPVRTRLTLFDAMGNHNFPPLVFYETLCVNHIRSLELSRCAAGSWSRQRIVARFQPGFLVGRGAGSNRGEETGGVFRISVSNPFPNELSL